MLGKFLCNQKGDISVAVLVSAVALASGLSLSLVAGRDSNAAIYQYDKVQELSLIRSEIRRGFTCTSLLPSSSENYTLPFRYVQVNTGTSRTTYALKTTVGQQNLPEGMQHYSRRAIATKVKAFRRPARLVTYHSTAAKSPIESYGVKTIQKQTFAGYMYLTDTDASVNSMNGVDDPVYFYGYDEIWGRVHSNSNIWCKQYQGWPLFHDHVSTAGHIRYTGGTPDPDEIFLDGYTEEAGEIEFNATATLIRQNGGVMFQQGNGWDIARVVLNNSAYAAWKGTVSAHDVPDTLIVYDMYPPYGPVGDSINVNYVTFRDTTWTGPQTGSILGSSRMVEAGELWISGICQGEQTWGSAGNMKLVDNLTYAHTGQGAAPDGYNGEPVNRMDYLGLVSEKSIIIQYGLADVAIEGAPRRYYNCDGDAEGIWIYAAMAALGDGEGDPRLDGVFTFEYQFPHYSTPSTTMGGQLYAFPDLHLGKYEEVEPNEWPWPAKTGNGYNYAGSPDPMGPDYPWYNPLWPETTPYLERGMIHIYGSVAQRRRGFVHRSGNSDIDNGYWDLDHFVYGPIPVYGQNAEGIDPNLRHGIGYNKDYHYDYRFIDHPPVDFPEVNIVGKQGLYQDLALQFMRPPTSF